jgi:hypothetical protein
LTPCAAMSTAARTPYTVSATTVMPTGVRTRRRMPPS